LKPGHPEYEAGLLSSRPRGSVLHGFKGLNKFGLDRHSIPGRGERIFPLALVSRPALGHQQARLWSQFTEYLTQSA
jgi:hypothetical protein